MRVSIPAVVCACALVVVSSTWGEPPEAPTTQMLNWTYKSPESVVRWVAVNDGVMGGLSQGGAQFDDRALVFAGTLSLENNGGFASIRHAVDGLDLTAAEGIVLRVRGDGRTYQLRISTDARYRGSRVSYRGEFETEAGKWLDVRVPFASMKPGWRGRELDGPPFNLARLEEIGLLIGDKRPGAFRLEIQSLRAYVDE